MRGLIFAYETIVKLHYRSTDLIGKKRKTLRRQRTRNEQRRDGDDNENAMASEAAEVYYSDSDEDNGNGLINSLIYEAP